MLIQLAHPAASGTRTASGRASAICWGSEARPPDAPSTQTSSAPRPTSMSTPCAASVHATARIPPRVS